MRRPRSCVRKRCGTPGTRVRPQHTPTSPRTPAPITSGERMPNDDRPAWNAAAASHGAQRCGAPDRLEAARDSRRALGPYETAYDVSAATPGSACAKRLSNGIQHIRGPITAVVGPHSLVALPALLAVRRRLRLTGGCRTRDRGLSSCLPAAVPGTTSCSGCTGPAGTPAAGSTPQSSRVDRIDRISASARKRPPPAQLAPVKYKPAGRRS